MYTFADVRFQVFHCSETKAEIHSLFFFSLNADMILYHFRIYKQALYCFPWALTGLELQFQG